MAATSKWTILRKERSRISSLVMMLKDVPDSDLHAWFARFEMPEHIQTREDLASYGADLAIRGLMDPLKKRPEEHYGLRGARWGDAVTLLMKAGRELEAALLWKKMTEAWPGSDDHEAWKDWPERLTALWEKANDEVDNPQLRKALRYLDELMLIFPPDPEEEDL